MTEWGSKLTEFGAISKKVAARLPPKAHRYYSSTIFKEILTSGATAIQKDDKYGAPIEFNPSWSEADQISALRRHRVEICINGINGSIDKSKTQESGVGLLIDRIYDQLIVPARREKVSAVPTIDSQTASPNMKKIIEQIQAHLAAGPVNEKRKTILDILGSVEKVEVVDGLVHRLFFKGMTTASDQNLKEADQIAASLSMLLTFRTGQDDAFVSVQDCLVDYLDEQRPLLEQRSAELQRGVIARAFHKVRDHIVSYWQSHSGENDPRTQFLGALKFFEDGKTFGSGTNQELAFIKKRLKMISAVEPFLKAKADGARNANLLMKKLSLLRVNYLLDMFLQLRQGDMPVQKEMQALSSIFFDRSQTLANSGDKSKYDQVNADFSFYHSMGEQLTTLEMTIDEQACHNRAAAHDETQIRQSK
jgi:hypothetical protein